MFTTHVTRLHNRDPRLERHSVELTAESAGYADEYVTLTFKEGDTHKKHTKSYRIKLVDLQNLMDHVTPEPL